MKLSELMAGYTPDEEYAGITNTDDFVLAIDIAAVSYTHLKQRDSYRLCAGQHDLSADLA